MLLSEIPVNPTSDSVNLQQPPATFLEGILIFIPVFSSLVYFWGRNRLELAREREKAELEERANQVEYLQKQNEMLLNELTQKKDNS